MGAPSQFASQSAPGTSGTGSPGGLFFKWFHGHFGNGGGGNGGGGHHLSVDGILWRRGRRRRFGW